MGGRRRVNNIIEHSEIESLRQELAEAQEEIRMYRALRKCLAQFAVSFAESQASMAAMAVNMQSERDLATQAAAVSADTRSTVQEIAAELLSLAEKSAQTVTEVESLHQHSRQVSDVIKFIQRISAQTHLLSMNAAVEAARPGEHGRGFAVLAKEVQNLSTETDSATKGIPPWLRRSSERRRWFGNGSIPCRSNPGSSASRAKGWPGAWARPSIWPRTWKGRSAPRRFGPSLNWPSSTT